jgi:hypothetical protein
MSFGSKLVATTHSVLWMNMWQHMMPAVAFVLLWPTWYTVAAVSCIGLVKDVVLDTMYATPTPPSRDVWYAAGFYGIGALIGGLRAGVL